MASALDVAVVGGGIVGCAVLFELNRLGYNCALLEKNDNLISEASSGNSGMLHTGFDAPADSLELHCIKRCVDRVFGVFNKLGVPYSQNGSVMVAWSPEQVSKLEGIQSDALAKGVKDVFHLSLEDLYQKEPSLSRHAHGALWIPEESILEPCIYGLLLAHHAKNNGAKILTNCEVRGYENVSGGQLSTLDTTRGPIKARVVINCAGLHGDHVQELAGISSFRIQPRKGQYTVFGQGARNLITSSILPVPTEKTKGIIVFKTVHGNVIVGPTAEDVESRSSPPIDTATTRRLLEHGRTVVPELDSWTPVGHYTGVRPATQYKDYQIRAYLDRNWITVGGIRSTGVSGSLGIAEYVARLLCEDLKLEPTRGATSDLQPSDWSLETNGTLSVDGTVYGVSHPITLFGTQKGGGGGGTSRL
ncbi:hypothetical protein BaRGS_00040514 [Batillaria attramentaria]|uniref:FAD dependent oxidoreductase domain-containing protein n=1 Tax=Batillaria attramentaria TaxID=370345 RepID=A0ABD0IZT6_9CAEN